MPQLYDLSDLRCYPQLIEVSHGGMTNMPMFSEATAISFQQGFHKTDNICIIRVDGILSQCLGAESYLTHAGSATMNSSSGWHAQSPPRFANLADYKLGNILLHWMAPVNPPP